jgi:ribosomal protein S13
MKKVLFALAIVIGTGSATAAFACDKEKKAEQAKAEQAKKNSVAKR